MWCLPGRSRSKASSLESGGNDAVKRPGLVDGCPFCRIAAEAPSPSVSTPSSMSLSPAPPTPHGSSSLDTAATTAAASSLPLTAPTSPATRVVLTSDRFVAFHDRTPRAKVHLLAVPREHVGSVKALPSTEEGAELVEALHAFGRRALEIVSPSPANTTTPPPRRLYGFHIPPFNSVDHLHLHCLEAPLSARARIKYCATAQKGDKLKGWTWFVTAEQAAEILRRGERVKVGSVHASAREEGAVL